MNSTDVSISVVTYNNKDTLPDCINSLLKNTVGRSYSIHIFDNNSCDETLDLLPKSEKISVIKNESNLGFGKGHNAVLRDMGTKYHAFVNPDIIIENDVLEILCRYLDEHPDVSLVTPKILNPDKTVQKLPRKKPKLKYMISGRLPFMEKLRDEYTMASCDFSSPTEIDFCTGCFMVGRTEQLKSAGGFDDRYFMYMEDADISNKMQKFGKIMLVPDASAVHLWNRESGKSIKYLFIHFSSYFKYRKKWRKEK